MLNDILKLSIAERVLLVEAIWDSIPVQDSSIEFSASTKDFLDERLAEHLANPDSGSSWEDVKARIEKKI